MSVYAFGTNSNGELGTGDQEAKLDPMLVEGALKSKHIVEIKSCESTALAVTDHGELIAWGRNREGNLGCGSSDEKFCNVPRVVDTLSSERIRTAAVGPNHCLAVTANGEVYHWGRLHEANEGAEQQHFGMAIEMPGMMDQDRKARMISHSYNNYYANDFDKADNSDTYGDENLNFANFRSYIQRTPKLVDGLAHARVVQAAAGYGYSVVVTDMGKVYTWGFNDKLQLGLAHRFNQHKPQLVRALDGVFAVQAACGQQHTLVLDKDGTVWSWGLSVFGQCGHNSLHDEKLPRRIETFSNPADPSEKILIKSIACGSHHSLALDTKGRVWSWGSSEYSQQFQSDAKYYDDWGTAERRNKKGQNYYYSIPRLIQNGFDNRPVVKVACGNLHNLAVTDNGDVYTWGWGQNGALGHGNRRFQLFPVTVNRLKGEFITDIAGGGKASYVVTSSSTSSFALDLKTFVDNPRYSDLTLVVGGKKIHAHKIVVFSRCEYLHGMYIMQRRFLHRDDHTLAIPNADYLVFMGFLRYLYTDHLRIPSHLLTKLEVMANRFKLPRLAALCHRLHVHGEAASSEKRAVEVPPSTFAQDMRTAINDHRYADITFHTDDGEAVHAHKLVLVARCEFFPTIFEGSFVEKGASSISIKEINSATFLNLLGYIYSNEIEVTEQNFIDLLLCSDRFLAADMKLRIEKDLEDAMDASNVVDLLLLSERTSTTRLRKACINFITNSLSDVRGQGSLKDLRVFPNLLREIDFLASKRGLASPGELLRAH